jgi:hypothetical protein
MSMSRHSAIAEVLDWARAENSMRIEYCDEPLTLKEIDETLMALGIPLEEIQHVRTIEED